MESEQLPKLEKKKFLPEAKEANTSPDEEKRHQRLQTIYREHENAERLDPKMDSYLDKLSLDIRKKYFELREGFLKELQEFSEQTNGQLIDPLINQILLDYQTGIDAAMVDFFETIGLKENPEVQARILKNISVPDIQAVTYNQIRAYGSTGFCSETGRYVSKIATDAHETIGGLKRTLIHEFLHTYIQTVEKPPYHNRPLNEGITEMLATMSLKIKPASYFLEVELAKALYQLDKNALMDWYTGGDSSELKQRLINKLEPKLGKEDANNVSSEIIKLKNIDIDIMLETQEKNVKLLMSFYKDKTNYTNDVHRLWNIIKMPLGERSEKIRDMFGETLGTDLNIQILDSEIEAIDQVSEDRKKYFGDLTQKIRLALAN
ncbi:hypothetical protein K9N08_02225 [Candidatus Gracilibacteria bacterium]|nr:hypothetical protein [Candidatus Gracilibacteria bacterium]MCF7856353.1 hypothetical protein [Candidatus Gracilibacteria bacterium]MCF7896742.1 hypothetical protein [Candidatus Gracilibacteria bacterium]